MTRRTLTRAERFGVWKAWSGMCFWCREPALFKSCEIDHVIPLNAVQDANKKQKIRDLYSLNATFDFDNFENFVPAHSHCNRTKSFSLFDPSPAFLLHLNQVRSKAGLSMAIATTVEKDVGKQKLLTMIDAAVRKGDVTQDDIEILFSGLPRIIQKSVAPSITTELFIAPGWKVIEERGHLVSVLADNGRFGMTSTSNDPSWTCSRCGHKGPWNGVICLTCGNREAPD